MTVTAVNPQPLIDAIKAAVELLGVRFGDGKEPARNGTLPWIVAWFDAGTYTARSLLGGDGWSTVGVFHCCGLTPASARIAVRRLSTALYGLHSTDIGGRTVHMPQQLSATPLDRDDDADPPVFVQVVEWRLRTSPT